MNTSVAINAGQSLVKSSTWLFWCTILIVLYWGIGWRNPWPADEPRFVLVALEMIQSSDWLLPHRGGELYPDKPPIFMWMIGVAYLITGSMKHAFLLPSLISAMVVLWLVYDLAERFYNQKIAQLSVVILLATIQFTAQAKLAQIDMTVTMWITLGNYGLIRHLLLGPNWQWYYAAWFCMGLGIITKGVGFLPLFMGLPYAWLYFSQSQGRSSFNFKSIGQHVLGLPVMLVATLLWLGPVLFFAWKHPSNELTAYLNNILFHQTGHRYVNAIGHQHPFHYYIISVIPFMWFPLSVCLPWLIKRWFDDSRQGNRLVFMVAMWSLLVLLFFSMSPGKRGVYLTPILPMLAVISGPYLLELLALTTVRRLLKGIWWLLGLSLTLFCVSALVFKQTFGVDVPIEGNAVFYFGLLCGLGFLVSLGVFWQKTLPMMLSSLTVLWLLYGSWGYSLMDTIRSPHNMMSQVAEQIGSDRLAMVEFREQYFLNADRSITHFGYHTPIGNQIAKAIQWLQTDPKVRWLLIPKRYAQQCFNIEGKTIVAHQHRRDWLLLESADVVAPKPKGCTEVGDAPEFVAPFVNYVD